MGTEDGQFQFPWAVACNSKDDILVSDSRNYRVQLFDSAGRFLKKVVFYGIVSSAPNGVAFTEEDDMVVTMMNDPRITIIEKKFFQSRSFVSTIFDLIFFLKRFWGFGG
jgi:tripartite motif-containing protein 71